MINRILIRMKVVQLLYSYLLTRNDFKLSNAPERKTRDNVFGYETYLNLILLLLKLSGYKAVNNTGSPRLDNNKLTLKVARLLAQDNDIKALMINGTPTSGAYDELVPHLYDKIISSSVFTDFNKKRSKELIDEIKMWNTIIDTVIAKDPEIENAARNSSEYTQAGFTYGLRLLHDTLNSFGDSADSLDQARKSLTGSLDKAYELYHMLLLLPVEITRLQRERIENAKEKYIPTSEDLNPNTRFIDNTLIPSISQSPEMLEYLKENPINLDAHYLLIKKMLDDVLQSTIYASYMEAADTDHARDCEFWRSIMKNVILPSDALAELLETSSIYWNDDLDIMGTFVLKTIKKASGSEGPLQLLPQYKDDDDAQFGLQLFTDTVTNREVYRSYIDRFINADQWDPERLAFMDIVIMMTAISELLNFPSIPIPVTLNEYIEIANSYSTPRSGQFVNGMLYSITNYLKEEGLLNKN